jgi:hypothetical protein
MLLTLILLQVRSQTYQGISKLIPNYYQFEFKLKNMILRPNYLFYCTRHSITTEKIS